MIPADVDPSKLEDSKTAKTFGDEALAHLRLPLYSTIRR